MTEKSITSFFEKRVLRPSKKVNYIQQVDPVLDKMVERETLKHVCMNEIKEAMIKQIQDSQELTRKLIVGKTVNPFFEKKTSSVAVKESVFELMEPLIPNYEDCHVGHEYRKSIGVASLFPKKMHQSLNYDLDYKIPLVDESSQINLSQVSDIKMTKEELDKYLKSHFSQDILEESCIQVMYNKLLGARSENRLDWNDKYAPACLEELLGCTNRIYASSLLTYIQEWKPAVAKKIRQVSKKATHHKLDDYDEFIVSDVDFDFDGFEVPSKHQLIIGRPGSGKTALISAVAKEADIGILEIHTGMKRSGKDLISTLGETTSSRLVGGKKGSIDPKWFLEKPAIPKKRRRRIVTDSTGEESETEKDMFSIDSETNKKPREKNQKKQTSNEPIKQITKPKVSITSFFKPIQKSSAKLLDDTAEKNQNVIAIELHDKGTVFTKPHKFKQECPSEKPKKDIASFFKPLPKARISSFFKPMQDSNMEESDEFITVPESPPPKKIIQVENPPSSSSPPPRLHGIQVNESNIVEPSVVCAKTASSRKTVILLDSVDVVTEQDKGFWNGVATLFETTKRPIILCCNENPLIKNNSTIASNVLEFLSKSVETFHVCTPEEDELTCYLTLMLLNEGIFIDPSIIRQICSENSYDIRQIILFLQISTKREGSSIIQDEGCFVFHIVDSLSSLSSFKKESSQVWQQSIIPDSLDDAVAALDVISSCDHRIKYSYFSDCKNGMGSTNSSLTDCSFLFPLLIDELMMPIQTAPRDVQVNLNISRSITDIIENLYEEHPVAKCETQCLPFHDFPKWPFLGKQLENTSDLLFWDGSIQVPRCFITEMLPWLSILLQYSHLIREREGFSHQKGRTRRSSRKFLRLFENELSDKQFQSIAEHWF